MDEHQEVDVTSHTSQLASLDARVTGLASDLNNIACEYRESCGRVHELERRVDVMTEKFNRYDYEFNSIRKDLDLIKEKQETIKERVPTRDEWNSIKTSIASINGAPAAKWEKLTTIIFTTFITGIVAYALASLLPLLGKQ